MPPEQLTSAQQIAVLQSLRPAAAAFVLGLHRRSLIDRTDIFRTPADGTYHIHDLLRAAQAEAGNTLTTAEIEGSLDLAGVFLGTPRDNR
jgi:hypothetical protein